MTKYRIVEQKGVFYPEKKTFLFWKRFKSLPTKGVHMSTSGPDGCGAFDLGDARKMLSMWLEGQTRVIHAAFERWTMEHDD